MGRSGAFVLAVLATSLAASCIDITTSGKSIVDGGAQTTGAISSTGTGGTSAASSAGTSGSSSGSSSGSTTGGCAPPCPSGFVCQAGECVCPAGEQDCGSGCVQIETDNDNCGGCGMICPQPYSRCSSAKCQYCKSDYTDDGGCLFELARFGQWVVQSIAVDSANLYFTNSVPNGSVLKVSLAGGVPQVLAAGLAMPIGLALDGTNVYWTDSLDGTVMKVSLDGGPSVVLATGQGAAAYVAVDSSSVYWTSVDGGTVMKVSIDGGDPSVLAAGQSQPWCIALDGAGSVYWTNYWDTGAVMKAPIDGGTAMTLSSASWPYGIAVSNGFVFWTNQDGGEVMRARLDGTDPTGLAAGVAPSTIAVDATSVYWTDDDADFPLMAVPIAGGSPTALITIEPYPALEGVVPIAVDSTSVYWSLYRLVPK
jgi:hypothetical protein